LFIFYNFEIYTDTLVIKEEEKEEEEEEEVNKAVSIEGEAVPLCL
jgi:hypothetical protein